VTRCWPLSNPDLTCLLGGSFLCLFMWLLEHPTRNRGGAQSTILGRESLHHHFLCATRRCFLSLFGGFSG
jgi:hypothetical protein